MAPFDEVKSAHWRGALANGVWLTASAYNSPWAVILMGPHHGLLRSPTLQLPKHPLPQHVVNPLFSPNPQAPSLPTSTTRTAYSSLTHSPNPPTLAPVRRDRIVSTLLR
jgi:hypothetical protein